MPNQINKQPSHLPTSAITPIINPIGSNPANTKERRRRSASQDPVIPRWLARMIKTAMLLHMSAKMTSSFGCMAWGPQRVHQARSLAAWRQVPLHIGSASVPKSALPQCQTRSMSRFRWSKDVVKFSTIQDDAEANQARNQRRDQRRQQQQDASDHGSQTQSTLTNTTMETTNIQSSRNSTNAIDDLSDAEEAVATQAATADVDADADGSNREDTSFLAINPKDINIVDCDELDLDAANGRELPEDMDANSIRESTFVNMFRGSANYIANHRNTLVVFHIPGDLMEGQDTNFLRDLMNDIALSWLLGIKIVIVAGCRYQLQQRIAGQDRHHGVTVTDRDALRVVKEVAGYIRYEIERQLARSLRMQGANDSRTPTQTMQFDSDYPSNGNGNYQQQQYSQSSPNGSYQQQSQQQQNFGRTSKNGYMNEGLGGMGSRMDAQHTMNPFGNPNDHSYSSDGNVVSGNFYTAQPMGILDGVDYKFTGFVRRVEVEKIRQVHNSRDIVLLTTLGVSPSGEVFNVNSESLAATVAGAMDASKIIFFTEGDVQLRHNVHGKQIQHLRVKDAHNLLQHRTVDVHKRGLVTLGKSCPRESAKRNKLIKIGWAMHALEQGVRRAHIISPRHGALLQELYTRDGSGTMLSRDLYDGIRQAKVEDVSAIHELITPLIQMGTLVDRPKDVLEKSVSSYHVYTRDDLVVASGQLKMFENRFAEIACLVVDRNYRSRGHGDAMLGYLERLCLQKGASYVFVLSTQTMEWFIERGFDEVDVSRLPPSRQAVYDTKRKSKIYMKKITNIRDLDASELWWNR